MKDDEEKLPKEITDFYDKMLLNPPPMSAMLLSRYKLLYSADSIDEDGFDPPKGKIEGPEWIEVEEK